MGISSEWDDAATCDIDVLRRGDELGGYQVDGDFALVIGGGTGGCFVVEGTATEVRSFVDRAAEAVEHATPDDTAKAEQLREAADKYIAVAAEHAPIEAELIRLTEDCETGGDYPKADDFRHYTYSDSTAVTLDAAQKLLTLLGYPAPVS